MSPTDKVHVVRASKHAPSHGAIPIQSLKLTFYDISCHFIPPTQRLLFYNTNTPYPTLVDKLKQSLSLALQHFYPLSGKLVWSPESDELRFECGGEGSGVLFIEAETDADFEKLAQESVHDMTIYQKLAPWLDISQLPVPLLSVQVTRFVAGDGVCIGVTIHHMAADGRAFCHFMKSWGEICKFGVMMVHPSLDRSVIRDPHGLSKALLDSIRPSLPKVKVRYPVSLEIMKRTLMFNATNIELLRERATKEDGEHSSGRISTFVAITAHAWACSVRAREVPENEEAILLFAADCRARLDPPVVQEYFGNCVKSCFVEAKGFELLGDSGFGFAVRAIQKVIRENLEEPLKDRESWIRGFKSGVYMIVASSPSFRVYDIDFGWGRPRRVELINMNGEGSLVLAEKRDEEGGLQVSIALAPSHMEVFSKLFFDGLGGGN